MSFGKASAPKAPDYTPIAQADAAAAEKEFSLGEDQLQWGRDQFNTVWPYAKDYLSSETSAATAEQNAAKDQQDFYNTTYKPIETSFANEATNYNTPGRAEQRSGQAMADVANTFEGARTAALQQLESYGIDPSQTRYGALDLSQRISKAAAMAAAGTQSGLNTEATGLALQGEAINTGRGYPSAVAQAYNTATNSGSSGINAANSTIGTGSSVTGTPGSYFNLANQSRLGQTNALGTGFDNQLGSAKLNYQIGANQAQGIGNLIGGGIGAALTLSDRRTKTAIRRVGTLDNGLPVYTFRYIGDDTDQIHVGVMADEAEIVHPEAVVTLPSGYKAVDYSRALEV